MSTKMDDAHELGKKNVKFPWRRLLELATPIWWAKDRPRNMRALLVLRFFLLTARAFLSVYITYPMKDMTTAMNKYNPDDFWNAIYRFVAIVCIFCPTSALDRYMSWVVRLCWRKWLSSNLMKRYFSHDNFYKLLDNHELDNPGMRICDDVAEYCESLLWIFEIQWNQFLKVIGFTCVLFTIAPQIVPFLGLYAVGGTLLVVYLFAPKLAEYNMHNLIDTANFRGGLIRARENAESIAFYRAGRHEMHWSLERLGLLIRNLSTLALWESATRFMLFVFTWIAESAPYMILAASYFAKNIEFGIVHQAAQAFDAILKGVTRLIRDLQHVTNMSQTCQRLLDVVDAFDEHEGIQSKALRRKYRKKDRAAALRTILESDEELGHLNPRSTESSCTHNLNAGLMINDLCLSIPGTGHKLVQNLTLKVEKGNSLLIVGPSGVGKSSLLRAVCGLWQAQSGHISMPGHEDLMFLPQNAYIPQIPLEQNTLRAQLMFPRTFGKNTDDEILRVLKMVNLAHMVGRMGVYTTNDWRKQLSGGEKQRLAMARLLLAKPKMAFLDESSSALDDDNERLLYSTLQGQDSSYVSVGHRKELIKYHSHILELAPEGKWIVRASPQFRPLRRSG